MDITEERPEVGGPHGLIATLEIVFGEKIDVGPIPPQAILFLRKPPAVLRSHDPIGHPARDFHPLFTAPPAGGDFRPIPIL